jgi:hypothetical protein
LEAHEKHCWGNCKVSHKNRKKSVPEAEESQYWRLKKGKRRKMHVELVLLAT